jgi:hypothetical protein
MMVRSQNLLGIPLGAKAFPAAMPTSEWVMIEGKRIPPS